ncbi:hypothetical protein [Capnocytophaga haemolytica]|jgi:hypothetical protein
MRSLLYLLLFLLVSQVSWGQRFADILKQYRQTDTRYTPVTAYFKDGALQIRGLKGKFKIKHPNEGYVDDFFWISSDDPEHIKGYKLSGGDSWVCIFNVKNMSACGSTAVWENWLIVFQGKTECIDSYSLSDRKECFFFDRKTRRLRVLGLDYCDKWEYNVFNQETEDRYNIDIKEYDKQGNSKVIRERKNVYIKEL